MNRVKLTASYALLHGATWSGYAVLLSFSSNYLYWHGMNGNQISLIMGLSTAAAIALSLGLAELVSRKQTMKPYLVLLALAIAQLVLCVSMTFARTGSVLAIGNFALACCLLQTLPGMVNAIGMRAIAGGAPINYGLSRGTGSLAYGVVSLVAGLFVARYDAPIVPMLISAIAAAFLGSLILFHLATRRSVTQEVVVPAQTHEKGFLKNNKLFLLFLVGSALLFLSHNLICDFMLQIMQTKGGAAGEQGTAIAIGALVELPVMFGFALLLRLIKCKKWVAISSAFFLLKTLSIFFAPTPQWVYAAQVLQMMGFGLFSISAVSYADELAGQGQSVRAQNYLASASSLGSVVALSTGGVLCQQLGAPQMLLFAAGAALAGMVIVLACTGKRTQRQEATP